MRLLAVALTAVPILVSLVRIVGGFALLARRLLGLLSGGPESSASPVGSGDRPAQAPLGQG
jgi:hypothetical protein